MRSVMIGAVAALLACTTPARAQSLEPGATVDAVFASWAGDERPGCTVAVERDGRRLLTRAYGMANLEHRIPATDQTVYEAGSVSKQFVAAAVVMLALEGRLSLDDDVRRHIPELPGYGAPITLRQMLNHTSGLRDWGSIVAVEGWPRGTRYMTNDRVLAVLARQTELNHPPGAEFIYSNSNYNLLTLVIERVSGQSLQAFTTTRLFEPLGMGSSRWRDDYAAIVPGRATAYGRDAAGLWRADMPLEDAHGNGGLLTTVEDLLIWARALDDARFGPDFMREMLRQGVLNTGETIDYASGLFITGEGDQREVSHSGSTAGYRAWLGYYPERDLATVVLCNAAPADATALARGAIAAFEPTLAVRTLSAALAPTAATSPGAMGPLPASALVGTWRSDEARATLQIEAADAGTVIILPNQPAVPLVAAESEFVFPGGRIRVEVDGAGAPRTLRLTVARARNIAFRPVD